MSGLCLAKFFLKVATFKDRKQIKAEGDENGKSNNQPVGPGC